MTRTIFKWVYCCLGWIVLGCVGLAALCAATPWIRGGAIRWLPRGWVVVTKDEDFAERSLRAVTGPQVLWLRIGNSTNRVLFAWLEPLLTAAVQNLQSGHRLVELQRRAPGGGRT